MNADDLGAILARLDALEAGAVEFEARVSDHDTLLPDHEERLTLLEADEPEVPGELPLPEEPA